LGFMERLSSRLSGRGGESEYVHREYIRCARCGETILVRVDKRNELTRTYDGAEGGYYMRKGVIGSGKDRCFQTIEVRLAFTSERDLLARHVSGGEFVTEKEYSAEDQNAESEAGGKPEAAHA